MLLKPKAASEKNTGEGSKMQLKARETAGISENDNADNANQDKVKLCHTNILDKHFADSSLQILCTHAGTSKHPTFLVTTTSSAFLLETAAYPAADIGGVGEAEDEFNRWVQCSKISKRVVKPLDCRKAELKKSKTVYVEILYEYGGEMITEAAKKMENREVVQNVAKIVRPMEKLMKKGYYVETRAEKVFVKDSKVRIAGNFKLIEDMMKLHKPSKKSAKFKKPDFTLSLSPPEIICKQSFDLEKVLVYNWGMLLYQLVARKTAENLEDEVNLKRSEESYTEFISSLGSMKLHGEADDNLKKWLVELLKQVLSFEPEERPSMKDLAEYMTEGKIYYSRKLEPIKSVMVTLDNALGIIS
eukprot:TRINITY_DN8474_c0_g2_i1.p1 TRINITY_DN8474_c0_g2~~TRINITY_DN8474_c0_g2_i1.p1  ORF type:complete len:359 (-),score=102.48 TRINITY_DN8474_c0_g2_i1:1038-2114(-)